jgi:surface protein
MHRVAPCRTAVQHVVSLLCRWAVAWRSHRLVGLALLLFLPAHVTALTAITNSNIGTAVTAWIDGDATTYGSIADWDTAAVTSMYNLFALKTTFNGDISKWNVASVSTMAEMFNSATGFNKIISGWNTASVSRMGFMFQSAAAFNQDIASWNTASVSSMAEMFNTATAFNQDIGSWNTARVSDMYQMFYQAAAFNQNIVVWNTASVSTMYGTFFYAKTFNQNLASWNVLRVNAAGWGLTWTSTTALSDCNKKAMYAAWGATFQTAWSGFGVAATCTVSSLTDGNIAEAVTAWIGGDATKNGSIGGWNTAAVSSMANLIANKPTFNADIGKWNVASASSMA